MKRVLFFLFVLLAALPLYAFAAGSGDMFDSMGLTTPRPAVPSDRLKGSDMFPHVPEMYNKNADLFDRMPPRTIYGNQDLLHARPAPTPYATMFQSGNYMAPVQRY